MIRKLGKLAAGIMAGFTLAALMAPTGGFPSRPTFASVTATAVGTNTAQGLLLSSTNSYLKFTDTDGAADEKQWHFRNDGGIFSLVTDLDTGAPSKNAFQFSRTAGALTTLALGNATDNPAVTINGVQVATLSGATTSFAAAFLKPGQSVFVAKAADTARNTTVTLADDPDLVITGLPAGTYYFKTFLRHNQTTTTTQLFKFQLHFTGTTPTVNTCANQIVAPGGAGTVFTDQSCYENPIVNNGTGTGVSDYSMREGVLIHPNTGALSIQWAQSVSNANSTTLKAGSYLYLQRIT